MVMGGEYVKIIAACIIFIKSNAPVTLYAPVHFMMNERTEILVGVSSFFIIVPAVVVSGHHGHILQMTTAAFVAHGTVMRMVGHQPFDNAGAERLGFFIVDGDPGVVGGRGHAGHDDATTGVVLVGVLLDRALAAGPDATKRGVPAELWNVEAQRQTCL